MIPGGKRWRLNRGSIAELLDLPRTGFQEYQIPGVPFDNAQNGRLPIV